MRHKKSRFQINRFTSWRKATLCSIAKSILIHQRIKTSLGKAKAVKPLIDKLIGLARSNTLSAKRDAFRILGDHKLVSCLFNEIGPRFANRQGGFSRIINLGSRRGDNADLAVLELMEIKKKETRKTKKQEEQKIVNAAPESSQEIKPRTEDAVKEDKHPETKKPPRKFMGGIRNIFKKERDSL